MKIKLYGQNGRKLDADIYKEKIGSWIEYTIESRGGKLGSQNQKNPDYNEAFEKLLELLGHEGCKVRDILVSSAEMTNRPLVERRVNLDGREFPFSLDHVNPGDLRREIARTAARVGRAPNSTGLGNRTRKLQLIVSERNDPVFVDDEAENFVLPDNNSRIKLGGGSGPPPSSSRAGVDRTVSKGFTYALALQGSEISAIKIGFTSDVVRRIGTLNREIRPALTKCSWSLLDCWAFETEDEAYEFEQKLLLLFQEHLVSGEREIISIPHDQFLNAVAAFVTEESL